VGPRVTGGGPAPAATTVGVRFLDPDPTARRCSTTLDTPVGELLLVGDGRAVTGLHFGPDDRHGPRVGADWVADGAPLRDAVDQVQAYLAGRLTVFDLAVAPAGSGFQRLVWRALADIPYGHTTSYGRLAAAIGRPTASRAVGAANGRNPVAILLPCHRVIGASGGLTGYGGGLDRKRQLLDLERRHSGGG
jgi:methylated-DNA-[protein]-cysteine S-methyltransferase